MTQHHDTAEPQEQGPAAQRWSLHTILIELQNLARHSEDDKVRLRAIELLLEQAAPESHAKPAEKAAGNNSLAAAYRTARTKVAEEREQESA